MKMLRLLGIGMLGLTAIQAQETAPDVLLMRNGDRRPGKVVSFDAQFFRLQVSLIPGQAAATVSVPRAGVDHIQFASTGAIENLVAGADPAKLPELAQAWTSEERFLILPKSPAATAGIAYCDLLLRSQSPENAQKAADLITRIERDAWDGADRARAKQVKLRAMVATGHAKDAITEALELAKDSEDPEILIEAKYILAQAAEAQLRKLEKDNPRWQEDLLVRPERNRLVNEAIDLYLYPYLFFGSDVPTASRGLWGAVGIYRYIGETHNALESSRDLVALYANTPFAKPAGEYIASLPPEITKKDNEKEAKQEP